MVLIKSSYIWFEIDLLMKAKNILVLVLAVLAVTGGGIALMLGEIHQGDLPADGDVPVTD